MSLVVNSLKVLQMIMALKLTLPTPFLAGPPKALDEDESEFLDKLEMVTPHLYIIYIHLTFLVE